MSKDYMPLENNNKNDGMDKEDEEDDEEIDIDDEIKVQLFCQCQDFWIASLKFLCLGGDGSIITVMLYIN